MLEEAMGELDQMCRLVELSWPEKTCHLELWGSPTFGEPAIAKVTHGTLGQDPPGCEAPSPECDVTIFKFS